MAEAEAGQVALGARQQIQTAVCSARAHSRLSALLLLPARLFSVFVGFLEPARPARLVWDRGDDVRVTSQNSGRRLLTEPLIHPAWNN